jgi:transposase InsO family protein
MANATFDAKVEALHGGSKRSYGRPRIVRGLREQGVQVGHERVRNSLKRQDLRPVYKHPYRVTTESAHHQPVAPNVLYRRVDDWRVSQAWVADITYISTGEGWLYLAWRYGSGQSQNRRLVNERAHYGRAGLSGVEVGVLAAQTDCGTDHAFGPRQSVREREPPAVDQ